MLFLNEILMQKKLHWSLSHVNSVNHVPLYRDRVIARARSWGWTCGRKGEGCLLNGRPSPAIAMSLGKGKVRENDCMSKLAGGEVL